MCTAMNRRAALAAALLAIPSTMLSTPRTAVADASVPTFSLKGVPGLSGVLENDLPRPGELGIIGRGKDKTKSGRLNFCDKKNCITSFASPEDSSYVPPWTYAPDDVGIISSYTSPLKRQLAEAKPKKTIEMAQTELRQAVEAFPGATIIREEPRYLYAEFVDSRTGATDDVEFLISQDTPIVGYRSAARGSRGDDRRQRERIRDLRKSLAPQGWKSVGRAAGLD